MQSMECLMVKGESEKYTVQAVGNLQQRQWIIGSGEKIKLGLDKWVPSLIPRINSRFLHLAHLLVSYLVNKRNIQWPRSKIRQIFHPHDTVEILKPRNPCKKDHLVWLPENNGELSVKSGAQSIILTDILKHDFPHQKAWGKSCIPPRLLIPPDYLFLISSLCYF